MDCMNTTVNAERKARKLARVMMDACMRDTGSWVAPVIARGMVNRMGK